MTNNSYRLDIQGLRGVSVLLVLFAHANWNLFGGGFIGVDIFFVISGYVITLLLVNNTNNESTVNLIEFYARRILRLLPLLMIVILFTLLLSFIVLIPIEQMNQYDSAISASSWVSNLYFSFVHLNYFALSSSKNFYLHTWSLSVEEQFYMVWPLFILLVLKYSKSVKPYYTILVLVLISFLLHIFLTVYFSRVAFYLMPSRAWEFGIGALAVFLQLKLSFNSKLLAFLLEFGTYLGITMIAFASMSYSSITPYPNWQVLSPTIGAFLLLLPIKKANFPINKLLSIKPLVFIGNLSYSLYLWHWPIFLFQNKLNNFIPQFDTKSAFLLTIILSLLSYYGVERPLKRLNIKNHKKIVIWGILTIFIMTIGISQLKNISIYLSKEKQQQHYLSIQNKLPRVYEDGCDDWYHSDRIVKCIYGKVGSGNKIVIFGDSILMQWFPIINSYSKSNDTELIVYIKNGCPVINRSFYYYQIMSVYNECDSWRSEVVNEIIKLSPKTVIIGNSIGYPFSEVDWKNGTNEIIEKLLPYTENIKLIAGTPKLNFNGPHCLARQAWLLKSLSFNNKNVCEVELNKQRSWTWQYELTKQYNKVSFIELSHLVCPKNTCKAEYHGIVVFRDSMHLSLEFVKSIQVKVIAMIGEI